MEAALMKSTEVQTLGALWRTRVSKRMRCTTNIDGLGLVLAVVVSSQLAQSLTRANHTTR